MPSAGSRFWWVAALTLAAVPARAQTWNSAPALALVGRAIARRGQSAADTALRDFQAHAHGFVFFLGQFGDRRAPPRLIRADQLELEVYWKAPGLSKQRIIGWRDEAELPTDIVYFRDNIGIIHYIFRDAILFGDGYEVRDVPHPLASDGLALYDVALGDTTTIALPDRTVRVVAVLVRPKEFAAPRVVGTLTLDVETGDLVRMAFSFTPHAYLDPSLDDVEIVLDNALWDQRFWLPYRQEIEIRRHTTGIDLPAWGIIRTRWVVDDYELNPGLPAGMFRGDEIVAAPAGQRDSFPWPEPLAAAIQGVAEPVREGDLAALQATATRLAGDRLLSGLAPQRLGVASVSDLVHVNRAEGLALGAGGAARLSPQVELRVRGAYGFADQAPTAVADGLVSVGGGQVDFTVFHTVRDVADAPVVDPLVNSFSAQELGADYGDYYRETGGGVAYRHPLGTRGQWSAAFERTGIDSLPVRARPASGVYQPNPAFPPTSGDVFRLTLARRSAGVSARRDLRAAVSAEGGHVDGGISYARGSGSADLTVPLSGTRALVHIEGGLASAGLPAYRAFVLGGPGTLLGDPFREWGGRRMALLHVEWRVPVPFVTLSASPAARIPTTAVLAPFVAVGAAGDPIASAPWVATPGARVTLGLALEWLGMFRVEGGVGTQTGTWHVAFDVTDALRSIL